MAAVQFELSNRPLLERCTRCEEHVCISWDQADGLQRRKGETIDFCEEVDSVPFCLAGGSLVKEFDMLQRSMALP